MFVNILLVIVGGGLGSACRYLFSFLAGKCFGNNFPIGTLGVNLIGCFLIGLVFSLAERSVISPTIRLLFMTGFLGGLTTFSTYALESSNFMLNGEFLTALSNIALNNLGGLLGFSRTLVGKVYLKEKSKCLCHTKESRSIRVRTCTGTARSYTMPLLNISEA